MDEFQKQMIAYMNEAKEKQKEDEERRKVDEVKRIEERNEVARKLNGLVEEISLSVKSGIKQEIKDAVEPIREQQDKSEKETEEANRKIEKLTEEVKQMKIVMEKMNEKSNTTYATKLRNGEPTKLNLPGGWIARNHTPRCTSPGLPSPGMEDKDNRVKQIIRHAKKVVGMKPIDKAHVQHTVRRNRETDKDMDEDERWEKALHETVNSFLKYEMKMKQEDIEELEIVKIFPPAKEEWNTVYVELESIEMVNFLMSFTQYMRRDKTEDRPSIEKYIPKELFARYSAVEKIAFEIRKESNFKLATNVSFGERDFVLKKRSKDIQPGGTKTPWRQLDPVPLPEDLPKFETRLMRAEPRTLRSPTQAPGRPALTPEQGDKRKERGTPGSPSSPASKQMKKTCSMTDHPGGRIESDLPALKTKQTSQDSTSPSLRKGFSVKA